MIRIIRAHGSRAVAEVAREVGWPRLSWRIERRSSAESSQRVQVRNPRAGHPRRDRYRPLAAWRAQPRVEPQCRTQSSWFNESVQTPIMVCHLLRCGFQGLCSRVADLGFRISTSNAHGGRLRPRLGHRCADRSGIDASYHQVANMLGLTELPAGIGRFFNCASMPSIASNRVLGVEHSLLHVVRGSRSISEYPYVGGGQTCTPSTGPPACGWRAFRFSARTDNQYDCMTYSCSLSEK